MPNKHLLSFFAILFISCFALISCSSDDSKGVNHSIADPLYYYGVNEQGVLVTIDGLLWFHDFESGEKTIVCNLPNCPHEPFHHDTNPDPICLATHPTEGNIEVVGMYDDTIIMFVSKLIGLTHVYQIDLSDSSRKELATFEWDMSALNKVEFVDDAVYFSGARPIMDEEKLASVGMEYNVMSLNLKTGETTQYGDIKNDNYAYTAQFKKVNDKLYYLYYYLDYEGEFEFTYENGYGEEYSQWEFYEIDIESQEEKMVVNLTEIDDLMYDYDEDYLYFLSEDKSEFFASNWERTESEVLFTGEDIGISSRLGDGFIYTQHELYDGTLYHYDLETGKTQPFNRPDDELPDVGAFNEWIIFNSNLTDGQVNLTVMHRDDFFAGRTDYTILR